MGGKEKGGGEGATPMNCALAVVVLCGLCKASILPPPPPPITPEEEKVLQNAWNEATASEHAAETMAKPPVIGNMGTLSVSPVPIEKEKISLVIPAIPRDVELLETRILMTLSRQTQQPGEVIIALSDTNATWARELEGRWRQQFFAGLLVLDYPEKQSAGENRNRGAAKATMPIISFMDADDRMHPQRLEIMSDALTWSKAMVAIHSFSVANEDSAAAERTETKRWEQGEWRSLVELNADGAVSTGQQLSRRWDRFISEAQKGHGYWPLEAHGHLTVSRRVMDDVAFSSQLRNEDTDFIKRVFQHDGKVVFVPLPLSEYAPSGVDGFFQNAINVWGDMQNNVFAKYGV